MDEDNYNQAGGDDETDGDGDDLFQVSQIRSINKKFKKRSFEQLADAMTEVNNVIPASNEEDANINDDQMNVAEDGGYEEAQQDDRDLQF